MHCRSSNNRQIISYDQQSQSRQQFILLIFIQATTPGSYPIQVEFSSHDISPFLKGLLKNNDSNQMCQFTLEITEPGQKNKKKKDQSKNTISLYWMPATEELDNIIQANNEEQSSEEQISEEDSSRTSSIEQQQQYIKPSIRLQQISRGISESYHNYKTIKKHENLEKTQFKRKLLSMCNAKEDLNEIRTFVLKYLPQFEIQQITNRIYNSNEQKQKLLDLVNIKYRRIGPLTVSQRKEKVERYLQKRKNRIWGKKISYDCRKRVADARLRIKGRFITRQQASTLLGVEHLNGYSQKEIKEMLDAKFNKKQIEMDKFNQLFN